MRKNKWFKFILIIFGLTFSGLFVLRYFAKQYKDSHCLITQVSAVIFDLNDIEIDVSGDLNKSDFKIKNLNSGKIVYENERYKKGIKNEYGFCLFEIYHKDSLLFEIGHFKFNNWHTNNYLFDFKSNKGKIDPTLVINGPDKNKGELFYKRFERNENGQISKVVFMNQEKNIYSEEFIEN